MDYADEIADRIEARLDTSNLLSYSMEGLSRSDLHTALYEAATDGYAVGFIAGVDA